MKDTNWYEKVNARAEQYAEALSSGSDWFDGFGNPHPVQEEAWNRWRNTPLEIIKIRKLEVEGAEAMLAQKRSELANASDAPVEELSNDMELNRLSYWGWVYKWAGEALRGLIEWHEHENTTKHDRKYVPEYRVAITKGLARAEDDDAFRSKLRCIAQALEEVPDSASTGELYLRAWKICGEDTTNHYDPKSYARDTWAKGLKRKLHPSPSNVSEWRGVIKRAKRGEII